MKRRPAIIAYEIANNRTRRRVYRILLEWRMEGQRSVHECRLLAWLAPRRPASARGLARVDGLSRELLEIN